MTRTLSFHLNHERIYTRSAGLPGQHLNEQYSLTAWEDNRPLPGS